MELHRLTQAVVRDGTLQTNSLCGRAWSSVVRGGLRPRRPGPGSGAEFLEHVGDVDAGGLRAHVQRRSDLAIRLAVGKQGEDLPFAVGQQRWIPGRSATVCS